MSPEAWSAFFDKFMEQAGAVGPWFVAVCLFAIVMKFLGIIGSIERVLIALIQRKKGQ